MFDLEQSIMEWRQRMLAAGIEAPVPLEELEDHLRDEFERQMVSGVSEQAAFNSAVKEIGPAYLLKPEFAKADGFLGMFHVLGGLWIAQCVWGMFQIFKLIHFLHALGFAPVTTQIRLSASAILILGGGVGGVCLFCGTKLGRRIILGVAAGNMTLLVWQLWLFGSLSISGGIISILNVISLYLLCQPWKTKLASA